MSAYFKKKFKPIKNMLNGTIQTTYLMACLKTILGVSVFTVSTSVREKNGYRFDYFGFLCLVFWYGLYFYCSYVSYVDRQTILRLLYDTRLKQHGDSVQDILAFMYVLFLMWKIPFDLSKSIGETQQLTDIDEAFKRMGESVDLFQISILGLISILVQVALSWIKTWTLWMILKNLEVPLPWNKMYNVVYEEMLMLIFTSHYCLYLIMVRQRYKNVNKILRAVKDKNSREYYIFVRERRARNEEKALQIQEKYVCEKIKTCANIVSTLYERTEYSNKNYGVTIVFTMFFCLVTITLNLFYLMEATASGLFYDVPRYCVFLVYVFWHIIVSLAVLYGIVCLCELTTAEAKATGFVIHQIINNNISSAITSEAMQLSLQLLHQIPVFTARGFYKLNYLLILEGTRSVVTFLVMLIQFVTDPPTV